MTSLGPSDSLIECHKASLAEATDLLLTGCVQGRDVRSDANMSLMKDICDNILKQYSSNAQQIFALAQRENPDVFEAITVNKAKADLVEALQRTITERETRKKELSRKLQVLRKAVPDQVRQQMKYSGM